MSCRIEDVTRVHADAPLRHQSGFIADMRLFGPCAWHYQQGREDVLALAQAFSETNVDNSLTSGLNRS